MPMDSVDVAQDISETYLQNLLKKHRHTAEPHSGLCLSCEEPVINRRFCDSFCREDFERASKMRVIQGCTEIQTED